MALHREVYKLGPTDGISNLQRAMSIITAMKMNTILTLNPPVT